MAMLAPPKMSNLGDELEYYLHTDVEYVADPSHDEMNSTQHIQAYHRWY